jgi:hypothetical protein
MFNVYFPDDIEDLNDLECSLRGDESSISNTSERRCPRLSGVACAKVLTTSSTTSSTPHYHTQVLRRWIKCNRTVMRLHAHWQAFIDAVERNDVEAVGRFILAKVQNGLIKQIEYDLIAERDARHEM